MDAKVQLGVKAVCMCTYSVFQNDAYSLAHKVQAKNTTKVQIKNLNIPIPLVLMKNMEDALKVLQDKQKAATAKAKPGKRKREPEA